MPAVQAKIKQKKFKSSPKRKMEEMTPLSPELNKDTTGQEGT